MDRGYELPPCTTVTVTVPLVAISPDHEVLDVPEVRVTVPRFEVNFQSEICEPVIVFWIVKLALPPRVTVEGPERVGSVTCMEAPATAPATMAKQITG